MLALVLMAIALFLRLAMAPVNAGFQYVAFFPAVTLSVFFAGFGPGLLTTILGILCATFFFTAPYFSFSFEAIQNSFWSNVVFLADGLVICFSIEAMHRYRLWYAQQLKESKQAHSASESRSQFLKQILDNLFASVLLLDSQAMIEEVNQAALLKSGSRREDLIGQSIYDLPAWSYDDKVQAQLLASIEAARQGRVQRYDTVIKLNEQLTFIDFQISPVHDENNHVVGLLLMGVDITDRKRAKALLQASEAEFRCMFEMASVGMAQVDPVTGQFLRINDAFCNMLGYSADELIGQSFLVITHPDDRQQDSELFTRVVSGETMKVSMEKRYLRKDGTEVWSNVNATTLRDAMGKPQHIFAIIEDITARKQAQKDLAQAYAQLQESERQNRYLSELLKQSDQPFGIGYPDGKTGYFNDALERLVGYSRDELRAMNWATELTPPEWRELEQAKLQELHRSGQPVRYEKEYFRKDGTRVPIELVVDMKTDEKGQLQHYYAFITDLTERKKAEAALLDADHRKDEFLAMLAHELRNPLAPIRNAAHILALLKSEDPKIRWVQEVIERQTTHLARMVDDLLDVARISQGKITLKKERFDLADIVHQVIKSASHRIEAKQQNLDVHLPESPILVEGDPVRLVQALLNLLDNASKYSPESGLIEVDVQRVGTEVEIQVRDHGSGIPAELLPRVFDLFQQAERTLDRSQGGLGIGLNLVKRLVELHDGQVTATSLGIGKGATFCVRLPALAETASLPEPEASTPSPKEGLRVLVVDDDADVRESTTLLLEMSGYVVKMADSGEQAITLIEAFHPDVVLLDIGMPGENGYQVAQRIRQLPNGGDLLLVALSGYGRVEDIVRSKAAGFSHHLHKPLNLPTLCDLLSQATKSSRSM